ncbi:MAG TPA: PAS domain S-box protein, partial [Phototrophicaceae bacterium]|nr:PAS domain S-box protein [Phototrophicaceae bacterium]
MNPLSSQTTPAKRMSNLLGRVWTAVTAPSQGIASAEGRRQAQILSALLLVLAVLSPIRVLLMHNSGGQTTGSFLYNAYLQVMSVSIIIFLGGYALSRTRYYRTAAGMVLIVTPLAIFGAIAAAPTLNLDLARFLVLDLLICGIVFSVRTTILVALAYSLASLFVLYGLLAIPPTDVVYLLAFLILGGALIIAFIRFRDLVERDRQNAFAAARDELSASSELYRTLARNLPQSAVLLYNRDLRLILAEGSALPQINLPPRIEGKSLYDVFEQGTPPMPDSEYYAALAGEERSRERVINGENYRARYLPVRNDSGVIVAGMLLLQNITKEKQSEAALRESEERYRLIAENATDLISVQTPDGVFLYASPASNALLGYEPEELIGHSLYEFLHPEDGDRVRRVRRQALETPGVTTIAYRFRVKDGSYTWLESASRVVNNAATGIQVVTASRDVSERMEATEALRRSEEQFRSLVASMDNLVFSIDLTGRFLVYHPMPSSIYDTPFDTDLFLGKHYAEVLPQPLVSKLGDSVRAVTSTLTTQQIDYSLKGPDDEERCYSARISPMIAANLQLLGSTVVVSDVTEAVRARERQQRLLGLETIQREIGLLLLASDDPNTVIDRVLEILGSFFDVARANMFTLRENERLLDSAYEWCAPGIAPDIQNLQGLAYDQLFPSLLPLLVNEGVVAPTHISELPPDLFRAFDALGLQSALILPIFVDERLEGFVSFYELRHPRKWQLEEIAAARTLVQNYARLLEREKAQLDLIEARDEAIRSAKLKSDFV